MTDLIADEIIETKETEEKYKWNPERKKKDNFKTLRLN